MINDFLSGTFTRIDNQTNFLDKKSKTQQSQKKVEIEEKNYGLYRNDSLDFSGSIDMSESIAASEMTFVLLNGQKVPQPKKKTVGGAATFNFEIPSWAKGIDIDCSVFIKQPVNFSDYFVNKIGIAKRHRESGFEDDN